MKKTFILAGGILLLAGCTAVPVPNSATLFPGLAPQSPTVVYVPQSEPVLTRTISTHHNTLPVTPAIPVTASHTPAPVTIPEAAALPVSTAVTTAAIPQPTLSNNSSTQPLVNVRGLQNLEWLGKRIEKNQMGGNVKQLVTWHPTENFTVLGIGRLIWYPAGQRGRFSETFPAFLNYAKTHGTPIPGWLNNRSQQGAPWPDKATFTRAQNDPQMRELRGFIQKTLNVQTNFMVARLKKSMRGIVQSLPVNDRARVLKNYQIVAQSPGGLYPLLDYVQFKGTGQNPKERYRGQGWGLLQVLQNMQNVQPGAAALAEFMRAADDVLVRRIANAPPASREARYLGPWLERINTYRPTTAARR